MMSHSDSPLKLHLKKGLASLEGIVLLLRKGENICRMLDDQNIPIEAVSSYFTKWEKELTFMIKESISEHPSVLNNLASSRNDLEGFRYYFQNNEDRPEQKKWRLESHMTGTIKANQDLVDMLVVSEQILHPPHIQESVVTVEEKTLVCLQKLLLLKKKDYYYPLDVVALLNGVHFSSKKDLAEFSELLTKKEFIRTETSFYSYGSQITLKGQSFLEGKTKRKKPSETISENFERVFKELEKLNIGHEILFEELQELKDLYPTLKRSTWGQLLKSKLVDLIASQIIDKETAQTIINTLTDGSFLLDK